MTIEWREEAISLSQQGLSGRQIAKKLHKSKSVVNEYLRNLHKAELEDDPVTDAVKILFIDIETAPILGQVWGLWDQNIGLNQIQKDWSILSYCAKWHGDDRVIYEDVRNQEDINNDECLLDGIWDLLNQADFVVGQNSKRFDVKKINARLILNGFPKPSAFRQIDTLEIAKREFGFTSNKLEYLTDKLCSRHKKKSHAKYPGHKLWSECLKGNLEAWEEMKEYNVEDVLSLEELYSVLSSWDSKLPNFDVYVDEILDMSVWKEDGYHYTNFGKYKKYRNIQTGQQKRSRVNLLSKEKRQSLLSNI